MRKWYNYHKEGYDYEVFIMPHMISRFFRTETEAIEFFERESKNSQNQVYIFFKGGKM